MVSTASTGAPDDTPDGYWRFNWSMILPGATPQ